MLQIASAKHSITDSSIAINLLNTIVRIIRIWFPWQLYKICAIFQSKFRVFDLPFHFCNHFDVWQPQLPFEASKANGSILSFYSCSHLQSFSSCPIQWFLFVPVVWIYIWFEIKYVKWSLFLSRKNWHEIGKIARTRLLPESIGRQAGSAYILTKAYTPGGTEIHAVLLIWCTYIS